MLETYRLMNMEAAKFLLNNCYDMLIMLNRALFAIKLIVKACLFPRRSSHVPATLIDAGGHVLGTPPARRRSADQEVKGNGIGPTNVEADLARMARGRPRAIHRLV